MKIRNLKIETEEVEITLPVFREEGRRVAKFYEVNGVLTHDTVTIFPDSYQRGYTIYDSIFDGLEITAEEYTTALAGFTKSVIRDLRNMRAPVECHSELER